MAFGSGLSSKGLIYSSPGTLNEMVFQTLVLDREEGVPPRFLRQFRLFAGFPDLEKALAEILR